MDDDPELPPTPGGGPAPDDPAKRLADVERELARVRADRDEHKASMYALLEQLVPYQPLTAEEVHDMFHGPKGPPLGEYIAELERELGATS